MLKLKGNLTYKHETLHTYTTCLKEKIDDSFFKLDTLCFRGNNNAFDNAYLPISCSQIILWKKALINFLR